MIKVIQKAAEILDIIAGAGGERVRLGSIATQTGLNNATCANILKALKDVDFVEQPNQRKGYTLGRKLYFLTQTSPSVDLLSFSFPLIDRLKDKINENVILSIVKGCRRELLYSSLCSHELNASTAQSMSIYRATTGRVIIANWSESHIEELFNETGLPGNDWEAVKSLDDLKRELAEIRLQKYYTALNASHIFSMAVPIFHNGEAIASLGFYMPYARIDEKGSDFLKDCLLETANDINSKLI
ncbi:MAG: helix-turn-helix domain-containing protein [Bacteroidales bacterium]|nr:helix-turn-helix domain-containing protein [Bacteroidales bacterium]